jgi:hypothetical protein
MKTMMPTAQIAAGGKLSLDFPTGLPPGPAEVVVVQPTAARSATSGPTVSDESAEPLRPRIDAEAMEMRRRALQEFIDRACSRGPSADSQPGTLPHERIPEPEPEPPTKFCSELFLGRLPEDYDIDTAIDEMNAQWKAKLEDLGLKPRSSPSSSENTPP